MKKALIVSTVSRQFYLFEQTNIKVLRDLGYEVHGAANFSDRSERLSEVAIIEHQIDFERSPFSWSNVTAYRQLKSLIEKENYDVVHCHSPVGGVVGRLAAAKGKKVLYTAHGFHFFKGAPLVNWLLFYPVEKILSHLTDILMTINQEDFLRAQTKFSMRRLERVDGIGVDYQKFFPLGKVEKLTQREALGFSDTDKLLIYVGELSVRKNQKLLIEAMPEVIEHYPEAKLLLVGRGELQETYKQMVAELGLEQNVEFLGFRNDVDKLMQVADIALSSSLQEGLPVNLMEAMGTGLPLLVSDCRGNRDLVDHEKNGLILPLSASPKVWGQAILRLLSDKQMAQAFGKASLELSKAYARPMIEEKMYEIYRKLEEM